MLAEVFFKKSIGLLSDKLEVEGPAAEQFGNRKATAQEDQGRPQPPRFVASKKSLELREASVT